jgi:hypothetical protein
MLVQELTDALKAMPQNANILGVFITRVGEMSENRVQTYQIRILSQTLEGVKHTAEFVYSAFVQEKRVPPVEKPLTQKPFAGIKKLFT